MSLFLSNRTKLFLDAYDLTLGGREVTWSHMRPGVEATDLSDSEVRQLPNIAGCELSYAGLWDNKASANEPALRSLIESTAIKVATLFLGSTENGNSVFTRLYAGAHRQSLPLGEALPLAGEFITERMTEYGRILFPKTSITSSSQAGASLDGAAKDGASSGNTGGVVWGYHVFALSSSRTFHISIQHASSDDATAYADFDADSSVAAVGGKRNLATGTLKRFVRLFVAEGSSGAGSSCAVAAFMRRL